MSDGKNGFSNFPEFDFTPIGQAIKKAREAKGIAFVIATTECYSVSYRISVVARFK